MPASANSDLLPDSQLDAGEGFEETAPASPTSAVVVFSKVVMGGVGAIFGFDPTGNFKDTNAARRVYQNSIRDIVPAIRPETPKVDLFIETKLTEIPVVQPNTGLTRFGEKSLPVFDLEPKSADEDDDLMSDPLGLGSANDNQARDAMTPSSANDNQAPKITKIRA